MKKIIKIKKSHNSLNILYGLNVGISLSICFAGLSKEKSIYIFFEKNNFKINKNIK
jgi:hypothetical protein